MRKVNVVEEEHAVLFTRYNTEEVCRLGVDARNCAVLDSACSSTVCGDSWLNNYIESLDKNDRQKVKQTKGQRVFKFGGGTCLQSKGEYSLPIVIAGKEATINIDVVESDIPLLLSRTAMKKAAVKMGLENDVATIMGKEVALNLTTSGHHCIPIDKSEEVPVENVCAVHLDSLNNQDRLKGEVYTLEYPYGRQLSIYGKMGWAYKRLLCYQFDSIGFHLCKQKHTVNIFIVC